jgi:hypothetical protein
MSKYDEPWGDNMTVPTPAQWRRAKACVNACAGLNPEGIKGMVEAVELLINGSTIHREKALCMCEAALAAVKEKKE